MQMPVCAPQRPEMQLVCSTENDASCTLAIGGPLEDSFVPPRKPAHRGLLFGGGVCAAHFAALFSHRSLDGANLPRYLSEPLLLALDLQHAGRPHCHSMYA